MKTSGKILGMALMLLPNYLLAQVTFLNPEPEAGSVIQFRYDPTGTKLAGKEGLKCYAYTFSGQGSANTPVVLSKEGAIYTAEVQSTDSTTLLILSFVAAEVVDQNVKGYYTKLRKAGAFPASAYANEAYLYHSFGQGYGIPHNPERAVNLYKQAFSIQPELRARYLRLYLEMEYELNKGKGLALINEEIKKFSQAELTEDKLFSIRQLYMLSKQQRKVDSVQKLMISKFPAGSYAWDLDYNSIMMLKDPVAIEARLPAFKAKYGYKADDLKKMSWLHEHLAALYGAAGNFEKFDFYADQITEKVNRAALYNTVAWPLAEKNQHSVFAARISRQSLELLDAAKEDPYPIYFKTKQSYQASLDRSFAMYADTYALILHNLGKDKEAVTYQEMAMDFSDAEGNERYVMYLDLSGNKEKAFLQAEGFLREGKGTEAMKTRLKSLYETNTSTMPFENYLANLEKAANEKEYAEWQGKMINEPAPAFSLKNMKGESLSLASLKGKIVVLDYWATWCGPCVASFPGMQKAVTKYAGNPNVVFLFINTRQTEANREELVRKFIAEKKYTFNVLYDTQSKKDPGQFDLVNAYEVPGIPTKFIIDGEGNIRFKVVGFSGSADAVVKELDTMIGLAGAKH